MNTKKVSVIIPCYNAAKYLPQCFLSLAKQTLGIEHLELIFVDDASTDDGATWELLLEMERAYPDSVIVIHLDENMRQGGARNAGLAYVTGEYIGFVDADDWVDETLFEKAYLAAQKENADIVQFGFYSCLSSVDISPIGGGVINMSRQLSGSPELICEKNCCCPTESHLDAGIRFTGPTW